MELNKRKSLLTPAAPTVWGMIHGDIDNQKDIDDRISEKIEESTPEMTNIIKGEIFAEINPYLGEQFERKQDTLESGVNIKTLKGRSLLGEGDIDPLDDGDRMLLETIETKADKSTTYTKTEVDEMIASIDGYATKEEVIAAKDDAYRALGAADDAYNLAKSANQIAMASVLKVDMNDIYIPQIREYVDAQIGEINTITQDILG